MTCHMEGIMQVLQAARMLTDNHLAPNEEYGLAVSGLLHPPSGLEQTLRGAEISTCAELMWF